MTAGLRDFVHRGLRSELFHASGGVSRTYAHALWTVARLGYRNELELWAFVDEPTALRVAARVAALRGREEDLEALADDYKNGHYQQAIDRYCNSRPQHVLSVQEVTLMQDEDTYFDELVRRDPA